MRRWEDALTDEIARVQALKNHESRARAIKRALRLTKHAQQEFVHLRDGEIVELVRQFGWTYQAAATLFGLSRARVEQILRVPSGFSLEACGTLQSSEDVAAAPSEEEIPQRISSEGKSEGAPFPKGNGATEPREKGFR